MCGDTSWSEWPSSKILETINAGEGVEKRGPLCAVGGNINWYSHYRKQTVWRCLKKLKIELLYDPAIPVLPIYPKERKSGQRDICTPILTVKLFTLAKVWKQLKCLSMDEWIKKMCCTYTHTQ